MTKQDKKLKITLVKSLIGRLPKHVKIAKQLGLKRMHSSVEHRDIPAIRGLIHQVDYLVCVEESV
jgi:large subunit ribosomal protein L30